MNMNHIITTLITRTKLRTIKCVSRIPPQKMLILMRYYYLYCFILVPSNNIKRHLQREANLDSDERVLETEIKTS